MIPVIYSHFPFLEFDSVIVFQFLLRKGILLLQPLLGFRYLVHNSLSLLFPFELNFCSILFFGSLRGLFPTFIRLIC